MKDLDTIGWVCLIVTLIGGINWGLEGLFAVNLVSGIFGYGFLARLLYIVIGVAAGYLCYLLYLDKKKKMA